MEMKTIKEVLNNCNEKYQLCLQEDNVFNHIEEIWEYINNEFHVNYSLMRDGGVYLSNLLLEVFPRAVDIGSVDTNLKG